MLKVAIVVLADTETLGDLGRVVNALQAVNLSASRRCPCSTGLGLSLQGHQPEVQYNLRNLLHGTEAVPRITAKAAPKILCCAPADQ